MKNGNVRIERVGERPETRWIPVLTMAEAGRMNGGMVRDPVECTPRWRRLPSRQCCVCRTGADSRILKVLLTVPDKCQSSLFAHRGFACNRLDTYDQLPMCNRWAIHFKLTGVSCRNRRAVVTLPSSPLGRWRRTASSHFNRFISSSTMRYDFCSPVFWRSDP